MDGASENPGNLPGVRAGEGEEEEEDVSHLNEGVTLKYSENVEDLLAYLKSHPMFMTKEPTVEDIDNNPLLQGIQALKYDQDNPLEYSEELKEEGNDLFKKKKYREAIVSYSEAIKQVESLPELDHPSKDFLAVLYTNRAAAQYYLGNRRSAMLDATNALKHKPDHLKALQRLCLCFFELEYYEDCIKTCTVALAVSKDGIKIKSWKDDAGKKLKLKQRNERKEQLKQQKIKNVQTAIQSRGVKVKTKWPDESFAPVPSLDTALGVLSWPVTFFYPEYLECDFIESFEESCSFYEQLLMMFDTKAPWDTNDSHTIDNLIVYYEDFTETPPKPVPLERPKIPLKDALTKQQVVDDYHLSYFVLPKNNSKLNELFSSNFSKFKLKFKEKLHSK